MSTDFTDRLAAPTLLAGYTAILFPGQGSQVDGMRDRVRRYCPELLDLADDILGEDAFANPETSTRLLQPAIYCASIAGWRRAIEIAKDWRPAAYAGHSLGEIAALACAGVLSPEDGLRLVALRGELMERMADNGPPGGMLAILGMDFDSVARLAAHHSLNIAGDNAPGQTVVCGDARILDRLKVCLEESGIEARRLRIKGAFHSPAMEPIRPVFEAAVRSVELRDPCIPVFSSVTAMPFDDFAHRLAQSLTHPVRWRETMYALERAGVRRYVETGPGKALTRIAKRMLVRVSAHTVETWDGRWDSPIETIYQEAV